MAAFSQYDAERAAEDREWEARERLKQPRPVLVPRGGGWDASVMRTPERHVVEHLGTESVK